MLVSRIAYDILRTQNPEALKKATEILSLYIKEDPEYVKRERNYPFVECSTFGDDVKAFGGSWQSSWHFADYPYLDEGGKISDYP